MNFKKIFWGTFLILLGIIFLLKQSGIVFFHYYLLVYLWPVFLIYWGITVLPVKEIYKLIFSLASLVLVILFIYFFIARNPSQRPQYKNDFEIRFDDAGSNDIFIN